MKNSRLPSKRAAGLPDGFTRRVTRAVFRQQKRKWQGDVNVVYVSNPEIRRLSRKFLRKDHFTDVIAFPVDHSFGQNSDGSFGDIFISTDQAKINARRFDDQTKTELLRLVIHGTLHLLGHDDHAPKARKKMWAAQEALVKAWTSKIP